VAFIAGGPQLVDYEGLWSRFQRLEGTGRELEDGIPQWIPCAEHLVFYLGWAKPPK